MALLELKRSLLLPAILLAASLTLVGCGGTPTDNSDDKDSSSSSSDDKDKDEAEEEEAEEEADASTEGNCPLGFEQSAANLGAAGSSVTVISASDFDVPEVGLDILASGCLFSATGEVDGTSYTSQAGYLPGDAAKLDEIVANLVAGGFTATSGVDGFYTRDKTSIVVFNSADLPGGATAAEPLNLGFGDNFLVITVIQA